MGVKIKFLTQILLGRSWAAGCQNSDGCNTEHTLGCLLPRPSPLPSYWYLLGDLQDLLEACPTAVWIFIQNLKQLDRVNTLGRDLFSVNDLKPQGQTFKVIYCHFSCWESEKKLNNRGCIFLWKYWNSSFDIC